MHWYQFVLSAFRPPGSNLGPVVAASARLIPMRASAAISDSRTDSLCRVDFIERKPKKESDLIVAVEHLAQIITLIRCLHIQHREQSDSICVAVVTFTAALTLTGLPLLFITLQHLCCFFTARL